MFIDCFMFSGELDALRIRMHELDDLVDKFVIIEGRKNFRNDPKPLYIDQYWDELRPWHDRIHKVIVEEFPEKLNPWEMEWFQRNQVTRALIEVEAPQDATVIVSDADEIPSSRVLKRLNLHSGAVHLDMNSYYFFLDWKVPDRWNQGGRPYAIIREQLGAPQEMRDNPKRFVIDGAWHFSYLGGASKIKEKIESFAHSEYDMLEYKEAAHLLRCIEEGKDPFNRFDLEPAEIDDTYPEWIQNNLNELQYLSRK